MSQQGAPASVSSVEYAEATSTLSSDLPALNQQRVARLSAVSDEFKSVRPGLSAFALNRCSAAWMSGCPVTMRHSNPSPSSCRWQTNMMSHPFSRSVMFDKTSPTMFKSTAV